MMRVFNRYERHPAKRTRNLRRTVHWLRLQWRQFPLSYCVGLGAFGLLLLELLFVCSLSLLRDIGISISLSETGVTVLLLLAAGTGIVCAVSLLIGMIMLSFTKAGDHVQEGHENNKSLIKHESEEKCPRPALALKLEDEAGTMLKNSRFLFLLLILWIVSWWVAFGGRWFTDESIGERSASIFLSLAIMAFLSMRVMRIMRRIWDRLWYYRSGKVWHGLEDGIPAGSVPEIGEKTGNGTGVRTEGRGGS